MATADCLLAILGHFFKIAAILATFSIAMSLLLQATWPQTTWLLATLANHNCIVTLSLTVTLHHYKIFNSVKKTIRVRQYC